MSEEKDTMGFESVITTDFSQSITSVDDFVAKIDTLNKSFAELKTSAESFDSDFIKMFKKELSNIKDGEVALDGATIKTAIERKIAKAVKGMDYKLTNLPDEPLQIKLSKKDWSAITKQVSEELRNALFPQIKDVKTNMKTNPADTFDVSKGLNEFQKAYGEAVRSHINSIYPTDKLSNKKLKDALSPGGNASVLLDDEFLRMITSNAEVSAGAITDTMNASLRKRLGITGIADIRPDLNRIREGLNSKLSGGMTNGLEYNTDIQSLLGSVPKNPSGEFVAILTAKLKSLGKDVEHLIKAYVADMGATETQSIMTGKLKPVTISAVEFDGVIRQIQNEIAVHLRETKPPELAGKLAPIVLENYDISTLTKGIKDALISFMANPENVVIPELKNQKIKVPATDMARIVATVQEALDSMPKDLAKSAESFKDIPKVTNLIVNANKQINAMMKSVSDLSKAINVKEGEMLDSASIQKVVAVLENVKSTAINSLTYILVGLDAELKASMVGGSSTQTAKIKSTITNFESMMFGFIESSLHGALAMISSSITSKSKQIPFDMSIVNQGIAEYITKAVRTLASRKIDVTGVGTEELSKQIGVTINAIITKYLASMPKVPKSSVDVDVFKATMMQINEVLLKDLQAMVSSAQASSLVTQEYAQSIKSVSFGNKETITRDMNLLFDEMTKALYIGVYDAVHAYQAKGSETDLRNRISAIETGIDSIIHRYISNMTSSLQAGGAGDLEVMKTKFNSVMQHLQTKLTDVTPFFTAIDSIVFNEAEVSALLNKQMDGAMKHMAQKLAEEATRQLATATGSLGSVPLTIKADDGTEKNFAEQLVHSQLRNVMYAMSMELIKFGDELHDIVTKSSARASIGELKSIIGATLGRIIPEYVKSMQGTLGSLDLKGEMPLAGLSKTIRSELARMYGVTREELMAQTQSVSGSDVISAMVNVQNKKLMDTFIKATYDGIGKIVKQYAKELKDINFVPERDLTAQVLSQLGEFQSALVHTLRRLIREQLKSATEEIKGLRLDSQSISSAVPKYFTDELVRMERRMASMGARGSKAPTTSTPSYVPMQSVGDFRNFQPPFMDRADYFNSHSQGGTTRTWWGSVKNTMRYITAGALIGAPSMAMHDSLRSYMDFEQHVFKARENLLAKYQGLDEQGKKLTKFLEPAQNVITDEFMAKEYKLDTNKFKNAVERERKEMLYIAEEGAKEILQSIALGYNQAQEDVGLAYFIASRRFDDPKEALAMTKSVAKMKAMESDMDITTGAKGLESIGSQWGLKGSDMNAVANMILKTSALSQVEASDLLQTQQRAGALFRNNSPGMSKKEALAQSFALSSLFVQSTARTGTDAGTFWKTIVTRPYTPDVASYMKKLSRNEGFDRLNPFVENEDGTKSKRAFNDVFIDIMDASLKMDDASKAKMYNKLFPERFQGGTEAIITSLTDEMNMQLKRAGVNKKLGKGYGFREAMDEYVQKIQTASDQDIETIIAGSQDALAFRRDNLKNTFNVQMSQIYDQLKPDMTQFLTTLTMATRNIGRFSTELRTAVTAIAKLGMVYALYTKGPKVKEGAQHTINEARRYVAGTDDRTMRAEYARQLESLRPRYNRLNAVYYRRLEQANALREQAGGMDAGTQSYVSARLALASKKITRPENGLSGVMAGAMLSRVPNLNRGKQSFRTSTANATADAKKLDHLDKTIARLQGRISALSNKMNALNQGIAYEDTLISGLSKEFTMAGIDVTYFQRTVDILNSEFERGFNTIPTLNASLRDVAKNSGLSATQVDRLASKVDNLVKKFKLGALSSKEFAKEVRKLESGTKSEIMESQGGAGNPVAEATAGGVSGELVGGFIGGSLLSGKLAKGLAPLTSTLKVGWSLLKKAGPIMAIMSALSIGGQLFSENLMTKGEKLTMKGAKREDLAKKVYNYDSTDNLFSKAISGLDIGFSASTDAIANLLGGSAPGLEDYIKAMSLAGKYDDIDLKNKLREGLNYEDYKIEGNIETRKEYLRSVDPWLRASNGLGANTLENNSLVVSVEEVQTFLDEFKKLLEPKLTKIESTGQISKLEALQSGFSEDSEKVRKLMSDFLKKTIDVLDTSLIELMDKRSKLVDGTEASDLLDKQIAEIEMQKAQAKYDIFQNDFGAVDEITRKADRNKGMIDAKYEAQKADAILAGATDESPIITAIDKSKAVEVSNLLIKEQSQLREQLEKFTGNEEQRTAILSQIMVLNAEQKKIMADVRKQMAKSTSTFNLPAGMQPLNYFDAMSAKATHSNVTVGMGDIKVNVNIGKDSNLNPKDIGNEVGKAVSDAFKQQVGGVGRSVASGVGSNYTGTRIINGR